MKVGNISLDNPVALGPMAGVTDLTFRLICKELGCGVVFTEMVSAKGIYYNDVKTKQLMRIEEKERPVALQIFGSDPDIMGEVAMRINKHNHDILDINMGCPVDKIAKKQKAIEDKQKELEAAKADEQPKANKKSCSCC